MVDRLPPTPFLAIDLPVLQANIERVAAWADDRGLALRPHVKTHKSPEIAHMQEDAGVGGLTVATVGEAEVFAQQGFDDLFVAYPLWLDDDRRRRLARLAERATLRVGFDSVEAARRLAGTGVTGLVEVDSGHHRSGVAPEAAGEVAAGAVEGGLEVLGAFTFPGHSYAPGGRAAAAGGEAGALASAAEALRAAGIEPVVLSGGSTPSLAETGDGLTESRPGVYVFNDAQQWELGSCTPDQIALTCHATVVSHAGGRLVLDSGSKVLGADRPAWASGFGRLLDHPEARIVILSEHHAVADLAGRPLPPLGSTVRVVPNHACNAVNLVDEYAVLADGGLVDRWAVAARGMNA
ncbi:alanine racemase [Propioniciclava sp. MC1595]|uniref:alanine racemase n=1 Tax=unclassified Propioniciclava TaxID=2642922 RepID=UPI0016015388|nr:MULTISPECIES: alanine racemase [unclassified Propioniciclava]MBB1495900.1 alanine racemase [Propioniciclava sp. MC1595]MBB1500627.1 alanine racemase [Propioniciclava sp. MC1683]QTE24616.1 alanine racemase [Propioniciclava sp. MC1595]